MRVIRMGSTLIVTVPAAIRPSGAPRSFRGPKVNPFNTSRLDRNE